MQHQIKRSPQVSRDQFFNPCPDRDDHHRDFKLKNSGPVPDVPLTIRLALAEFVDHQEVAWPDLRPSPILNRHVKLVWHLSLFESPGIGQCFATRGVELQGVSVSTTPLGGVSLGSILGFCNKSVNSQPSSLGSTRNRGQQRRFTDPNFARDSHQNHSWLQYAWHMMFTVAAATLLASGNPTKFEPTTWFGPAVATFHIQFTGNPYDPKQNDVRVQFVPAQGTPEERIAYYDAKESVWKAILVTRQSGTFQAKLIRNGTLQATNPAEGLLEVKRELPKGGYVRIDPQNPRLFRLDSGVRYTPLGANIGWGSMGKTAANFVTKFGEAGANWARAWACHWDGKNPWWPDKKEEVPDGQLSDAALSQWQEVVEAADATDIRFQFVLFHHGAFSSRVNPNWPDHPWNAKNGGFLKDAADFFTDAEAKRRAKLWLRYAVARYGHSPSILAWELFNEVEWVDARYAERWRDIEAWHQEMADYLREIDPMKRLVTSSSDLRPGMNKAIDFLQPHTYPPSLTAAISGLAQPPAKPIFWGEFGPGGNQPARDAIRDGIYASLMAGHGGAAQYWFWDIVEKENLYSEFTVAQKAIRVSGWEAHPGGEIRWPSTTTEKRGDLVIRPGKGFSKSYLPTFDLPADSSPAALSRLSSYVQAPGSELSAGPVRFNVTTTTPTEFRAHLAEAAAKGAKLVVRLDGQTVITREFPAAAENRRLNEVLKINLPAGRHTVEFANEGSDWLVLDRYEVGGIGYLATSLGRVDGDWGMFRVTSRDAGWVELDDLGLPDGAHSASVFNLATGETQPEQLTIKGGKLRFIPRHPDVLLIFKGGK